MFQRSAATPVTMKATVHVTAITVVLTQTTSAHSLSYRHAEQ